MSATTFTAYLQVIAFGLKGLQIERSAQEVMANLAALRTDFDRFRDDFELVGKHLSHAHGKYADADKRLDKLEAKLERASEMQVELGLRRAARAPSRPRRRLGPRRSFRALPWDGSGNVLPASIV